MYIESVLYTQPYIKFEFLDFCVCMKHATELLNRGQSKF